MYNPVYKKHQALSGRGSGAQSLGATQVTLSVSEFSLSLLAAHQLYLFLFLLDGAFLFLSSFLSSFSLSPPPSPFSLLFTVMPQQFTISFSFPSSWSLHFFFLIFWFSPLSLKRDSRETSQTDCPRNPIDYSLGIAIAYHLAPWQPFRTLIYSDDTPIISVEPSKTSKKINHVKINVLHKLFKILNTPVYAVTFT